VFESIRRFISYTFTAIFFIAVGALLATLALPGLSGQVASAIDDSPSAVIAESSLLAETQEVFSNIYNTVSPGVVSIIVSARTGDNTFQPASTGSGFVVDKQGHIVTNFHVVDQADRIEITMFDGTITRAEIVGLDPDSDLAVIRVNLSPDRLHPIGFADSDTLQVGQTVLAIGNPFANDWTLTSGIISALNRRIIGLNNFSIGGVIQTDAAINPGNSGGPLINLEGEVIGVNSQIESQTRSNSGVGFAAPSNLVKKVAESLIQNGRIEYSYIGISSGEINLDLIERFDLPDNIRGVAVTQALPNTPAANAGIQTVSDGSVDIITAIDGHPVADFDEMIGYLAINTNPGDTVNLTVYRGGQVLDLPVTLTNRPQ